MAASKQFRTFTKGTNSWWKSSVLMFRASSPNFLSVLRRSSVFSGVSAQEQLVTHSVWSHLALVLPTISFKIMGRRKGSPPVMLIHSTEGMPEASST